MEKLKPLFPYLRPYRRSFLLGLLCVLATAWFSLLTPLVIGHAIDSLKDQVSWWALFFYGVLMVGITAAQGVFQYGQRLTLVKLSRHVEYDIANDIFQHLERLDAPFFQKYRTGDLMARMTNDLSAVRSVIGPAVMYGANTVFTSVAALALMLQIHVELTLVSLASLPLIAIVTKIFGQRIHVIFQTVQEDYATLSAKVQENLGGARVIRAYAREADEEKAFAALSQQYVDSNRRLIRWNSAFRPLLQLVNSIGFVLVLWYGGLMMVRGSLTIGEFVTFNLFLGKLIWPMIAIGWVINFVQRGTASLGRIREILDSEPQIRDEEPLVHVPEIRGAVHFRQLELSYEEQPTPALQDIDLQVDEGTTVAVVGRTGAGKSTLLSLIPRRFDPPPASLLIDGVDVRRLPLATLRQAIAMVRQETFLFSTTIRKNIAFGKPEATDDEILEAANLAGLDRDLSGFPQGLDTMVGERGVTLSGGQKQRVALARAILRDPRILLLDDCLSAVDAETEARILGNLRRVFPGRTVFLVTHRMSTAQMANLIVVLEHGRIVERGTHEQLIARGCVYADLYRRQKLEEQLAAVS